MSVANAVYLAARYSRIDEMRCVARDLRSRGYRVTSRWIEGNHQIDDAGLSVEAAREERERFAREDWEDLQAADIVVNFTEPPRSSASRGGRHVEYGAALAWGKTRIVVGPRENVFHCLKGVPVFDTWEQAVSLFGPVGPLSS